jgi:hypothetical protein
MLLRSGLFHLLKLTYYGQTLSRVQVLKHTQPVLLPQYESASFIQQNYIHNYNLRILDSNYI